MTLSGCQIRLGPDNVPTCQTCGMVIGVKSAAFDCPRRREHYGMSAPVLVTHTTQAGPAVTR